MYNPGYQVDVIDPYYPPPVEVIEVVPQPAYAQPTVVVTQPQTVYVEDNNGPTREQMECCLLLGACCVAEEAGCVIL
ncbi:hypothetical protein AWZ03_012180 [Drosophila navojoa]|uniref:Uncharacterized protein n=1 Tax=Drosophila navojoa TaxID=7232 RepID=A0A484AYA4_DRONA|nr:uncharacterized protein LOC108658825 [Drosophila navojoa]TDG41408.1 hypothetical protein AWZ03_012180 [Drosophila navojoa]